MQVCSAILKLQKKVIKWLDKEEGKITSARIEKTHGFVNCDGLIDGTLFPLAFAPTLNAEVLREAMFQQQQENARGGCE